MNDTNRAPVKVDSLPTYLEFVPGTGGRNVQRRPGRGAAGWTVYTFPDARAAARFFLAYQFAAMPCWERMQVIDGELFEVR